MPSSGCWLDNVVILRSRRRRRIPRSGAVGFGRQTGVGALSSITFYLSKVKRFFPIFLFGNTPKRKISGKKEKTLGWAVILRWQRDETLCTMRCASTSAKRCVVCGSMLVPHPFPASGPAQPQLRGNTRQMRRTGSLDPVLRESKTEEWFFVGL